MNCFYVCVRILTRNLYFAFKWSSKVDIVEKRGIKIDIASYQILFPNIIFYYFRVFPSMGWALKPNMLKGVICGICKAIAMCM